MNTVCPEVNQDILKRLQYTKVTNSLVIDKLNRTPSYVKWVTCSKEMLRAVFWILFFDRKTLETIFDEVITVDVLDSGDSAHLTLMKRPELGITLTKLHCWSLTQYSKCVFMDADTLVSMALMAGKMDIVTETS